jgi:hypothetical protein
MDIYQSPFTPNVVEQFGEAADDEGSRELPPATRGVRVQLTAVQVMDGLQGMLGVGKASGVYVLSSVADNLSSVPVTFTGRVYRGINNGDMLPLGTQNDPAGVFNVYLREAPIPRLLSFAILVLRSNADLREIGAAISALEADARYKSLADRMQLALSAVNPVYGVISQAVQEAIGLLASFLGSKRDDQLGYYQANYTNLFDDLGAGKHPADGSTMPVDKIRLAYQIDAM